MSIFRKKHKEEVTSIIQEADTQIIKTDFTQRTPFSTYIPVGYKILSKYSLYRLSIDVYMENLSAGELDYGNADVLDELIDDVALQAEADLDYQKAEHIGMIDNFAIRREADQKWFTLYLEQLDQKKEELSADLTDAKERYEEYKKNNNKRGEK